MSSRLLVMLTVVVSVVQGAILPDPFILTGGESWEILTSYSQGTLNGTSSIDVLSGGSVNQISAHGSSRVVLSGGSAHQIFADDSSSVVFSDGSVNYLYAENSSSVTFSGGSLDRKFFASGTSRVDLSDGYVNNLFAEEASRVSVSGGVTSYLGASGTSEIELTGGEIESLDSLQSSQTTFYGYGWSVTGQLSIVGDQLHVVGDPSFGDYGTLTGFWGDDTPFTTLIWKSKLDTAVVRLFPIPTQNPCGECKGKVSKLTLQYTGTEAATVRVEQKGKKDKKGKKKGDVSDGEVVFERDLEEGDVFTFEGLDDKGTLGTEISLFINDALNTKIHTSCSKPIYPGMTSGLFEVVEGYSLEGGLICSLDTEPTDDSCECKGKVTQLTLLYTGQSTDPIVVTGKGKKDKKTDEIIDAPIIFFEDDETDIVTTTPEHGREFTISGYDDKGTLGTEIYIYVGNDLNTTIHTSCSQPIGIGLVFGDFTVIEGSSREGGPLCVLSSELPE